MTPVISGDDTPVGSGVVIRGDDIRQRLKDKFVIVDLPPAGTLADVMAVQQAAALETLERARNIAAIHPNNGRYRFHARKGPALFVRVYGDGEQHLQIGGSELRA